ncbi:MAG: protease inhibitor I42 family protein [Candidatus Rokubacteria bacterium]|nr:protease inhibitor I42 family protein [Candidatus Rokubacteria bacterium]
MADVVVTKVQDGRVLAVKVGDSISVQLPENPTTGYAWALDSIDDTLLEVGGPAYHGEDAGLGSGGVKAWTLRARAPGRTRVALKRSRYWEGDHPSWSVSPSPSTSSPADLPAYARPV